MDTIERDTYTGKYTVTGSRNSDVFTAAELAAMFTGTFVVWEHVGTVSGRSLWGRTRFVAQPDGSLAGFDSDGVCKIIHPADRRLRIITK